MKKIGLMLAVALSSPLAQADGFVCNTVEQDLTVKIYNHTQPARGTRTGAVMVLSDPSIGDGNRTIARFQGVNGLLESSNLSYEAKVDLRFADSRRQGELILGTKLGQLATIRADLDFSFSAPALDGESLSGMLTLTKRNGSEIVRDLECVRYLKN